MTKLLGAVGQLWCG